MSINWKKERVKEIKKLIIEDNKTKRGLRLKVSQLTNQWRKMKYDPNSNKEEVQKAYNEMCDWEETFLRTVKRIDKNKADLTILQKEIKRNK